MENIRKIAVINTKTFDHMQDDFEYPTYEDVKNLRLALGFNRADIARIVGTHIDVSGFNSATVRAWESNGNRARKIPISAWYLMLITAGLKPIKTHDISKNIELK